MGSAPVTPACMPASCVHNSMLSDLCVFSCPVPALCSTSHEHVHVGMHMQVWCSRGVWDLSQREEAVQPPPPGSPTVLAASMGPFKLKGVQVGGFWQPLFIVDCSRVSALHLCPHLMHDA